MIQHYHQAIRFFEQIQKSDFSTLSSLASFLDDLGRHEEARLYHRRALQLLPTEPGLCVTPKEKEPWAVTQNNYAACLYKLAYIALAHCMPADAEQYLERALADFDTGLKAKPRHIRLRMARAKLFAERGEWAKAEEDADCARRENDIHQEFHLEYQRYHREALALLDDIAATQRSKFNR